MTFIVSAAALDRSWGTIEGALADAGHRLRSYKCGVWAPGFGQFEDAELPLSVRNLCLRIPHKRHGVSLLGSEANAQHCMQIGLGQAAEAPTQTKERVEKALVTLQNIERFKCDQHDYVSFAKAWMLKSKGVAHALDCDFRLVSAGVMAPLERRLEGRLRQTMSVLLGSEVSEMAWERAKLPTCYGGLGIRVAQMGFAAQATYWSTADLHKAVMPSICEAFNRPIREPHLDCANAPAAKVDLLLSGVAVDRHARFTTENEASKVYEASPWAADKRAAETFRQAPVQTDERVPPKILARDMAFAKLQSRILSAVEAVQAVKLHAELSTEQQAIMLSAGGPDTGTSWTATHKSPTELAQNAQWRMATALRHGATPDAGPRSTCALRRDNDGHMCKQSLATHPFHLFCCKYGGARNRPHRAVQCTLRRLIEQAGDHADMERHVPELYDWDDGAAPGMRCAILDVVSWFRGVLQQL